MLEKIDLEVKKGISTTFFLPFTPDKDGKLSVSGSCGCTTFKQNKFDVKKGESIEIEAYMNKSVDFTGSVFYWMEEEGVPKQIGITKVNVKIV